MILPKLFSLALALTGGALAATIPETDFDVIVVGGGPAGLSALSALSRVRRSAALFDSHQYRNDPTREMHDVIGNDGTPPALFRAAARAQISNYSTASFIDTTITSITPVSNNNFTTYFRTTDNTGAEYTSRKIVLATGLIDLLPANVPGLVEGFGKGIFWCPWCDGYEHRDQPFGILGEIGHIVSSLLEVTTLNSDIIAFVNGTYTDENVAALEASYSDWRAQIAAYGVRIENRTIASFTRLQDGGEVQNEAHDQQLDVFRVDFTEGEPIVRNAFLTNFGTAQRSGLPYDLGLAMTEDGKIDTSSYSGMRTSLSGVFAIGDANSDGSTNVPHAMFSGKRAGVYGHVELAREDMAAKIAKRSVSTRALHKEAERLVGDEMEKIWERVKA
ncbi:hypothetical protein BJY01DRAFT_176147 [Aspergillus pseudoustus]|uniref:FAD/NAD(P)-binding domain-containing protein n=1 Tax=Aspergillus pseudoustus TaxID=1810923 RepID=A0ABR4K271_9EURO